MAFHSQSVGHGTRIQLLPIDASTCSLYPYPLACLQHFVKYFPVAMLKVSLSSGKELEIADGTTLDSQTFEEARRALATRRLEDILDAALFLRSNFAQSSALLDMAEKNAEEGRLETVKMYRAGLIIQHKMDPKEILQELQFSNDRRYDFLKGVFLLNMNQIEDAQFCFEKVGYKKGLELCAVMLGDKKKMALSTDPVVKCYCSFRNWDEFDLPTSNKDFLYIIGKSDTFENKDNVDVEIKHIEEEIGKTKNAAALSRLAARLNQYIDSGTNSPQIMYDIGKTHHISGNLTAAATWYDKALELDSDYLPAKFNLARIKNVPVASKHTCPALQDFNAVVSMKNLIFDVDLNNCTDPVRRLCRVIVQARTLSPAVVSQLDSIKSYVPGTIIENNKAVILNNEESEKILKRALETADSSYGEFIRYNLGIAKRDATIFNECSLPEAQIYRDYLNNNLNTPDLRLRAYLTGHKHLLDNMTDAFSTVFVGNGFLDEYIASHYTNTTALNKAEMSFRLNLDSPLCINGLAICAVFWGNFKVAVQLFTQIVSEFPAAVKNLAFCHLLQGNYAKAAECLTNGPPVEFSKSDEKAVLLLAHKTKDLKIINILIERGFTDLVKMKALILVERGDFEKALELGVKDPEVVEKVNELKQKDEARKRKMAEIEEFRKRRATR